MDASHNILACGSHMAPTLSGLAWLTRQSSVYQGVEGLALCLDGEYVDFSGSVQPSLSYDSECGRNGLRAAVVVVWDAQERYGFSDITPMTFDNEFSVASMSVPEIDPDMLETVLFVCKLKSPQNFRVDVVEDATQNIVKTWTSPSPSAVVTYEWDGTDMYGTGVEDDTYRFVVTLIDKPGQPKVTPKRLEVSRVGLGQARAVIVNTLREDAYLGSYSFRMVEAIRAACKRAGLTFKVFNPGNAYWEDYGPPDRPTYGLKSWLQTSGIRMLYVNAHGSHWIVNGQPLRIGTVFSMQIERPDVPTELAHRAFGSITKEMIYDLHIPAKRIRLAWIDACGSGRRNAGVYPNLKHPDSWRNVHPQYTNDLAHALGIKNPQYYEERASYYMGWFGIAYVNQGYYDMVRLFFDRFSQGGGTQYTLWDVMTWLASQSAVTSELAGPPALLGDWLVNSPPYYNIRVFTDSWLGYGPYYAGLKMADMRY